MGTLEKWLVRLKLKAKREMALGPLGRHWLTRLGQRHEYHRLEKLRNLMVHRPVQTTTKVMPDPAGMEPSRPRRPWGPLTEVAIPKAKTVEFSVDGIKPFYDLTMDLYIAGAYLLIYGKDEP